MSKCICIEIMSFQKMIHHRLQFEKCPLPLLVQRHHFFEKVLQNSWTNISVLGVNSEPRIFSSSKRRKNCLNNKKKLIFFSKRNNVAETKLFSFQSFFLFLTMQTFVIMWKLTSQKLQPMHLYYLLVFFFGIAIEGP